MKNLILLLAIVSLAACKKSETLPDNFSNQYSQVKQINANGEVKILDCTLYLTTVNDTVTFELVGANTGTFKGVVIGSGKTSIVSLNNVPTTGSANYGHDECKISINSPGGLSTIEATK